MSKQTGSQVIVERNRLKKLSVTISMTAKSGYSSKTVFKSKSNVEGYHEDSAIGVLYKAIEELAFISYFNMTPVDALDAFKSGLDRAVSVDRDSDITW